MKAETKQWAITGSIVVVLVLLLWWGVSHKRPATPVVDVPTAVATTSSGGQFAVAAPAPTVHPLPQTAVASGETVTVEDQAAGTEVHLSEATLKQPSWIAIRDTKGHVLGAHWFGASVEDQTFTLLRSTSAGQVYQAVIYVDNGDKKFDLHADTLLTSSEDAPVSSTFTAQ